MAGEEKRIVIESRSAGGGGPWQQSATFPMNPQAASGIERTLKGMAGQQDKATQIANKTYLTARAMAPALRLVPGLGPIMAGASIAVGRSIASSVAELKTANTEGLAGMRQSLLAGQNIYNNIRDLQKMSGEGQTMTRLMLRGNLQEMGQGLGKMGGAVLKMLPVIGIIASGIMAILSFSRLFRTILGAFFGIISAFFDILLLPFLPFMTMMLEHAVGMLDWAQKIANFLSVEGVALGGLTGGIVGGIGGLLLGGPIGALIGALAGVFVGTFIPWLFSFIPGVGAKIVVGMAVVGALFALLVGWPILIVAAIMAAIGLIIVFHKQIWSWLKGIPKWIIDRIKDFFDGLKTALIDIPMKIGKSALSTVTFGLLQEGTPYVPKTGPYTLHQGEAVVPANLRQFLGMNITNYFVLGTAQTSGGIEHEVASNMESVIRRVVQ